MFFFKNSSLVTIGHNLFIYNNLQCDELIFQLITHAYLVNQKQD